MPAPPPVMVTTAQFWKNSRSRLFHVLLEIVSISYMNRKKRRERGEGDLPSKDDFVPAGSFLRNIKVESLV